MKRLLPLLLAALLLLSAAGCTERAQPEETPAATEAAEPTPTPTPKPTPKPTPTPEPTPTPTPEPTPEPGPAYRNPLNGAPMEEPYTLRPFTLMVNNHPESLPHHGVSQADILYEVLVEGGITRMMCVFSDVSKVDKLMSIRSIRPYFLDIAKSYGAVICHAGGSEAAYSRVYNEKLENIDGVRGGGYGLTVFERDSTRLSQGFALEHTLFTTGERLLEAAKNKGYPVELDGTRDFGLRFVEDATPEDGQEADKFTLVYGYYTVDVSYDPENRTYHLYENRRDYTDGNTGEIVGFRNAIAIFAPVQTLDGYGRLAVDTTAGGDGYYFCGGKYIPITWSREDNESFRYFTADGGELNLSVGNTYVSILPTTGSVKFPEPAETPET